MTWEALLAIVDELRQIRAALEKRGQG